jgi:hypothetical protein
VFRDDEGARRASLRVERCITGPLRLSAALRVATLLDSIVDGGRRRAICGVGERSMGPRATIERCTVFGDVDLAASVARLDSLIVGDAPDDAAEAPSFVSTRYGDAAYAQLAGDSPATVLRGASNGSERGAFQRLRNAQRVDALHRLLPQFIPIGLATDVIHVD